MASKLNKFFRAFPNAFNGIVSGFKERNMRFHGVAAVFVLLAGWIIGLDRLEWFVVYILIALVWAAELINTAVEELANIVRDELKLEWGVTRRARDTAAGAVLVLSIMAALLGVGIFLVRILELLGWS